MKLESKWAKQLREINARNAEQTKNEMPNGAAWWAGFRERERFEQEQQSQPIDTNHPDYMRLVVHTMD